MIRLEKLLTWNSSICYDDVHVINDYIATISLHTNGHDQDQQNIAYERMKWWIEHVLANSVLLNEADPLLPAYQATRQRVLVVPDDPVDHLVAVMLYLKLNAIMEDRLILDEIRLSSEQGDHMCYLHSEETDAIEYDTTGWWIDPRPIWFIPTANRHQTNVLSLPKTLEWSDLGLSWNAGQEPTDTVVVADFNRYEN